MNNDIQNVSPPALTRKTLAMHGFLRLQILVPLYVLRPSVKANF